MAFPVTTVHGLSADVYFNNVQQRVFGDIVVTVSNVILDLTANDEGNVNPVNTLRRGDLHTITVPLADATSLSTISGVTQPFASGVQSVSGTTSGLTMLLLPKAKPGDQYQPRAKELRLVLRDGSATWIYPLAIVTKIENITMSEEKQMIQGVVFQAYRTTVSGQETPFVIVSGSIISGGYSIG